jgi:hypothetical protein
VTDVFLVLERVVFGDELAGSEIGGLEETCDECLVSMSIGIRCKK